MDEAKGSSEHLEAKAEASSKTERQPDETEATVHSLIGAAKEALLATDFDSDIVQIGQDQPNESGDAQTEELPDVAESIEAKEGEVSEELEFVLESEEFQFTETDSDEIEDEEEFVEQDRLMSVLESLLFSTDKPLSISVMHQAFAGTTIKPRHIRKALSALEAHYAEPHRGVTLEEAPGGYQLRTKLDNADYLKKLNRNRPFRLTGPALEALSIIAYQQPIIKAEIDQIRGVESGHLVRALMEKNLVCFAGKSELPGKPMQYGTTKKFLEIFGLRSIKELPSLAEIDELLPEGIGDEEDEKESLGDITAQMSEELKSSYSDGEEELHKITDQLSAIDTSSEFFEEEKRRQREKRDRDRARDIQERLDVGEEVDQKDVRWLQKYEDAQRETLERLSEEGMSFVAINEATQEMSEIEESNQQSADAAVSESDTEQESVEATVAELNLAESEMTDVDASDDELAAFLGEEEGTDCPLDVES